MKTYSQQWIQDYTIMDYHGSVCTDGAEPIIGKYKGFLARVSQIAAHINFIHCIIHRENLASKTQDQQ